MNVYLINPPAASGVKIVREGRCMARQGAWTAVWAPVTLALLAALLEKEGWTAKLIDCIVEDIDFPELENRVREFRPDLVVINVATPSLESDLSTCRAVKRACPETITAVIGIHPAVLPEECLNKEPALDIIVRGEPEMTVKEIAAALAKGRAGFSAEGIAGTSHRSQGAIRHEPDREFLKNLDDLPFPAWQLIDRSRYRLPFTEKRFLLIATSRGCPYPCAFCADAAFYGKKLRLRSPARLVDELAWVKETFGIDEFLFWSEAFTISKEFCTAVANEILRRGLKVSWVCNSRVDNVTKDMLALFKKAGCWMIGYGMESGTQSVLDSMRKGITVEQIEQAVRDAHDAGLEVTGHSVLGYPGETFETMRNTVRLAKKLPFDFVQFYCAVPFPGSALYAQARDLGWLITDDWSRYEQNFSVITTPQLTAEEVMAFRKKAYRSFYFRPRMVWNVLKRMRTLKQIGNLFSMLKDFLAWVK